MSARRILITGVSGFVGRYLAERLAEDGDQVMGLGFDPPPETVRAHLAESFLADLREPESVRDALATARPDRVIHLAAQSSASRSFRAPTETFAVNVLGTWNLLSAVREVAPAARVLMVGSGEVYGPQPEGTRVAEDAPMLPVSPYALSKAAADAASEAVAHEWGLDVIRVRPFSHTGRGQTATFVVPGWAEQIARIERSGGEPVVRVGNLDVTRDLSDVRDVVEAYRLLLERGRSGAVYNVCRGEGVRLSDVIARMCAMATVPIRIEVDPDRFRPADVPWLVGDPSAIARELGWHTRIALDDTLRDVLDAARAGIPE